MKLQTKLTAFSVLLIAAAIIVCCAMLLSFSRQSVMEGIAAAGLKDYEAFYYAFLGRLDDANGALTQAQRNAYLKFQLMQLKGGDEYTLQSGSEMIANEIGIDARATVAQGRPKALVFPDTDAAILYTTAKSGAQTYFISVGELAVEEAGYTLSLVRDITGQADKLSALTVKCAAVGMLVTALFAAAVLLLMYDALKPVQSLKAGAAELAQGRYENRIALAGRDELSELASDFNRMADAIEANMDALHEKSERQQAFINDLSHELKTPVTSILLCAETLLHRTVPPEAMRRALERIYDQGKWMETLSQKLMTLVLLQGEIALQPGSVAALLEAVRATAAGALRERGMELTIDCTMDVLPMDFDLLRAALVNLVENARKASADGQAIEIHARGNVIAVADHGRGIPQTELARVTEPFYMADRSRSKKLGGAGLGLALVKRIAEAHGATLAIDSVLGRGTAVRLTFPPHE